MIRIIFISLVFLVKVVAGQNALTFDVKGGGTAPLPPLKLSYDNENGWAVTKSSFSIGAGISFILKNRLVFSVNYSYSNIGSNRNTTLDAHALIQNSSSPSKYSTDGSKYWYGLRHGRIQIHNPKIAFGYVFRIKNFVLVPKASIGVIVYIPPKLFVDEHLFDSTFTGRPGQRPPSLFLSTIESFTSKPAYTFSYGVHFSAGYRIYKELIASIFAEYTGSSNINYSYFQNYQFGYSKSIQQITYGFKIEYIMQLKSKNQKLTRRVADK